MKKTLDKSKVLSGPLIVLLGFFLLFSIFVNNFLSYNNFLNVFRQSIMLSLVALGQLICILLNGINLSLGSVLGLTTVSTALLLVNGMPLIPGILLGLGVGLITGLISGWLISYLNMPPFIATFGISGIALGLGLVISNESVIWDFSDKIHLLHDGSILGIPLPLIIIVGTYLLFHFILRYTSYGTSIYAIGGNAHAAELSGISVKINKMFGYGIAGLMASAAGIMMMSRLNSAQAVLGSGYEFDSIAAVVLGGTSLSGGEGGAFKTLIGVVIIAMLRNGLNLLDVNVYLQSVSVGLIIIIAYIFDYKKKNLSDNLLYFFGRRQTK